MLLGIGNSMVILCKLEILFTNQNIIWQNLLKEMSDVCESENLWLSLQPEKRHISPDT